MSLNNNTIWHRATVTRERREKLNNHKSVNLWFTGLSGSGKSTLAHAVEEELHRRGCRTYVFDGDNVRHGLCADLSFSIEDRQENIRRIGEMIKAAAQEQLPVIHPEQPEFAGITIAVMTAPPSGCRARVP